MSLVLCLGGCSEVDSGGATYPIASDADVRAGSVVFTVTGAEIGIINLADTPFTVDNRALFYWSDGRWTPCIEEGQWQDAGWGIDLQPGAAVTGGVAVGCPPEPLTGLKYADLVVFEDGHNTVSTGPLGDRELNGPDEVTFAVPSTVGCLLKRSRAGQESLRIFTSGLPWVQLKHADTLEWIGCDAVSSSTTRPHSDIKPGVWRVGQSAEAGRYALDNAVTPMDCLSQIQQDDVFGPVIAQPTDSMELLVGQIVGTDCSWEAE